MNSTSLKTLQKNTALYLGLILLCLMISASVFAAIDALNFQSPQQEQDYHSLTQELRCPQCQNNNIADSNATIAVDMRAKVFELLQQGKNKQQVVDYMVARYGNFVTYNPPLTQATILLWLIPALLVIVGLIILFRKKPQQQSTPKAEYASVDSSASPSAASLTAEEQQRLQNILNNKDPL